MEKKKGGKKGHLSRSLHRSLEGGGKQGSSPNISLWRLRGGEGRDKIVGKPLALILKVPKGRRWPKTQKTDLSEFLLPRGKKKKRVCPGKSTTLRGKLAGKGKKEPQAREALP